MFLSDVWKSIFPKSAAKVVWQTAKTCQYVEKNAFFLQKSAFFVFISAKTQ